MKIGTSLGRCLADLLNGVVDYDDVFCIVSRTRANDIRHLLSVVDDYWLRPEAGRDLTIFTNEEVRDMARRIWNDGKLHQPRLNGDHNQHALKDTWYDIVPSEASNHESVKVAWQHYRMLSKLVHGDR